MSEQQIQKLEFELAEAGTDILDLRNQLAKARAEIKRLKAEIRDNNYLAARQIVPAEMAVDDLHTEIERKDNLIEQMREVLKLALTECRSTHCENEIKAALAAERGGNEN